MIPAKPETTASVETGLVSPLNCLGNRSGCLPISGCTAKQDKGQTKQVCVLDIHPNLKRENRINACLEFALIHSRAGVINLDGRLAAPHKKKEIAIQVDPLTRQLEYQPGTRHEFGHNKLPQLNTKKV